MTVIVAKRDTMKVVVRLKREKEAYDESAMIAFMLPIETASALVEDQAHFPKDSSVLPMDEMHITLYYLGKVEELFDKGYQPYKLKQALEAFAKTQRPFEVLVTGVGKFEGVSDGKQDVYHAEVDNPEIQAFRAAMIDYLKDCELYLGEDYPEYNPHVTLAYVPAGSKGYASVPNISFSIDKINLVWGTAMMTFPFGGPTDDARDTDIFKGIIVKLKGGPGSGHKGHEGRPGKRGGSLPGSGLTWRDLSKMSDDDKLALINSVLSMDSEAYARSKKAYGNKAWDVWIGRNVLHDDDAEAEAQRLAKTGVVKAANLPVSEQDERITTVFGKFGNTDDMSDARLREINNEISSIISERSGVDKTAVSDVLGKFNASTDPEMVASLQKASVAEFSTKLSAYQKRAYSNIKTENIDEKRRILRAVYDETQQQLNAAGYKPDDTITLYRGFVDGKKRQLGSEVGYKGNAVESWTIDFAMGQHFATGASFNDDQEIRGIGYVFSANVRVGDIFSVATAGPGVINEGEVLVFGSRVSSVKIHGIEPTSQ